jgi:hypothetical protein
MLSRECNPHHPDLFSRNVDIDTVRYIFVLLINDISRFDFCYFLYHLTITTRIRRILYYECKSKFTHDTDKVNNVNVFPAETFPFDTGTDIERSAIF